MNFFNIILGGSIPYNIIESMEDINTNIFNLNKYNYLKINENNSNIEMTKILDSKIGSYFNISMDLNRNKIHNGLYKLLNSATNDALNKNRNELASLINLKNDDIKIDKVIYQFAHDLSNSIVLLINGSNMNENAQKIFTNIIHLTGITNKTIAELRDIEKILILQLELPNDFKNETRIHMLNTFKLKLTPSNIKKCENDLLHNCIFDKEFLFNLSHALLESLEVILDNIMKLTKHNELPNFYAFTIDVSNNIATVNVPKPKTPRGYLRFKSLKKGKPKVIEKFGVQVGNTDINVDSTKVKDISEIEKNIDQSKVISGMSKILSGAISKATSKNQSDLIKAISASNKVSIGKVKGTSFTLTNISQTSKIDTTTEANFIQEIKNKIINDITIQIKQAIDTAQKDSIKDMNKLSVNDQKGTTVGEVIDSVAAVIGSAVSSVTQAATEILAIGVNNTVEKRNEKEITKELKDKFNLNQKFEYKDDNDVKNQLENILSSDNLAKCGEELKAGGELNIGDIDVKEAVNISNIKQEAIVNTATKCLFNQTVINDISNKIINSQERLIKQLMENVNDKISETDRKNTQGDIYAAGTAGAAIIASTGTALSETAQGLGKGASVALEGAGKGLSLVAESAGKGMANLFSGFLEPLKGPLMIVAVVAAIGLVIFLIMKFKGSGSNTDSSFEPDEE